MACRFQETHCGLTPIGVITMRIGFSPSGLGDRKLNDPVAPALVPGAGVHGHELAQIARLQQVEVFGNRGGRRAEDANAHGVQLGQGPAPIPPTTTASTFRPSMALIGLQAPCTWCMS